MIKELDYLILSGLSYGNFKEEDIGSTLEEALFTNETSKARLMSFPNEVWSYGGRDIFEKTFFSFLSEWKIIGIQDETYKFGSDKTGFYAVAFEKHGEIVIAYRGTELNNLGDAYKDFIETDLMIGVDKKPKQFEQGVAFYEKIREENHEKIALTGHSLGGGIAQYVALISDLKEGIIPKVYTWNAVGINKSGILSIYDFMNFETIIDEKHPGLKNNKTIYKKLEANYFAHLTRILKKKDYIKDKESIKKFSKINFKIEITEELASKFESLLTVPTRPLLPFLNKKEEKQNELINSPKALISDCFDEDRIYAELTYARKFIDRFKKNLRYNEKVINFVHSEDFTVTLYPHIGSTYVVNKGLKRTDEKMHPTLKKMYAFTKSMRSFHMYQVFLPFFEFEGSRHGEIRKDLSLNYIVTEVRRVIYQEKNLPDDFLGFYYDLTELDEDNYYHIKKSLIYGVAMSKADIKYLKETVIAIKRMDFEEFKEMWGKVKKKVGSPFIKKDIYDLIIFDNRNK